MNPLILKIGYGIIALVTFIIRYPHEKRNKSNKIRKDRISTLEKVLLLFVMLGMMVLPLVYIFSDWFSFADYYLPLVFQVTGLLLIVPMAWLFYRSHKDLGSNWSVSLEIREGHNVVNTGVYKRIRHPMYTAIFLWCICQALLLNNYISGLSGLWSFGLLYIFRVKREEEMMMEEFGNEYFDYAKKTKRIIPFIL